VIIHGEDTPKTWQKAIVIPLFNKGDREVRDNYKDTGQGGGGRFLDQLSSYQSHKNIFHEVS
jgi:hypothetical protein